jgi:hypothetical protein
MAEPQRNPAYLDVDCPNQSRSQKWFVVAGTGINCGIASRYWLAVYTRPPPLTIDWTPLVYWALGILFVTTAIRLLRSWRDRVPVATWRSLMIINLLLFSGYLIVPTVFVFRTFASIKP